MTFTELVSETAARLNLTSTEATVRIGRLINVYHRRITTAIGVKAVARPSLAMSIAMTPGSAEATFTSCEKVSRVYYLSGTEKVFPREVTLDEIQDESLLPTNDTPRRWAVKAHTALAVTVKVDTLADTAYALKADGLAVASTLSGSNTPLFPESFHDILMEGVLKDEYKKMEKVDLARASAVEYETRLSDLRMWAASSKYLRIRQGEHNREASFTDLL